MTKGDYLAHAGVTVSLEGSFSLPYGWRLRRLGEALPIVYGKALTGASRVGTGKYPVVGSSGIVGRHTSFLTTGPAIVIGRKGSAGAVHYVEEPCWPIDTAYFVAPAADVDTRYAFYLLSSLRLKQFDQSSAIPSLSRDHYSGLVGPFPDLDIQRRIVARIDELFAEIEEGEQALAEARAGAETYRKALLKAAVTGELTADWRARHPEVENASTSLKRMRDTYPRQKPKRQAYTGNLLAVFDNNLFETIPETWCWSAVGDVIESATYGTSVKCSWEGHGLPVLRMGNIQDGSLDNTLLKFAPAGKDGLPLLKNGDVVFNRTNSAELLGKTAVYKGDPTPCSFASYIVSIRLREISPDYFAAWMNSVFGRHWISRNKSQQVGQANLSAGKLMNMPIPLPPNDEQHEIARALTAALSLTSEQIEAYTPISASAAALRQSILAAAFRGELAA